MKLEANSIIGVLHHRIKRINTNSRQRLAHPSRIYNLANHSTFTRDLRNFADMGSSYRHVRRLSSLQCRSNMALYLFDYCRILTILANVDFFPSMSGISTRCSSSFRNDDSWKYLQTRTQEKPRLLFIRCMCCSWILSGVLHLWNRWSIPYLEMVFLYWGHFVCDHGRFCYLLHPEGLC